MVSSTEPQIQPGHSKKFCPLLDGSVYIQCISSFLLLYCLNYEKVLWDGDSKEKGNINVKNQVAKNQAALYEWAGLQWSPKSTVQLLTEGLKWAEMYFVKLPACSSLHRSTETASKRTCFRNACWSTVLSLCHYAPYLRLRINLGLRISRKQPLPVIFLGSPFFRVTYLAIRKLAVLLDGPT